MRHLRRAISGLLSACGALLLIVLFTPVTVWWASALAEEFPQQEGEVLIVLAGSSMGNGVLGETSYWRVAYAVLCWREGWVRTVVLTGAGTGRSAAEQMRDFLVAHGVPAEQIVTETGSRNTRESALAAAGFLRGLPGRRVLLTSDYHLYRSRRAFAKAGVEVAVRALPDVRKRGGAATGRWSAFQDLCLESAKIAYYRWQGWI